MSVTHADHAAWLQPGLHAQVVRTRHDGRHETALHIDNLHGPHQVLRLQGMLQAIAGVHRVHLDVAAQRLRASWDPARSNLSALLDTCAAAGCPALPLSVDVLDNPRRSEAHAALKRLVVAGLFAMQAMMFASVLYIGHFDNVDPLTRDLFRWLELLAATPVVTWAALPFYRGVVRGFRHRQLTTDTPVALAVLLIYLASIIAVVRGQGEVYFDSISMLVFVLLVGRYLEMRARHRSGAQGEAASDAEPVVAERRRADGSLERIAATELTVGDRVHVAEGGMVPADGRLANACVRVDESLLSGESRPLTRRHGERIVAGSVVIAGPLDMRVEQAAARSTLAALGDLARRVSGNNRIPPRDPVTAQFAVCVLLLTGATAVFWLLFEPARALDAALAVLVVACPCALALAAPLVSSRMLTLLGRKGVWVTRAEALNALARVDHALFDKTGTLTTPQLDIADIKPLRGQQAMDMLCLAASLARESRHPLARMIAAAAADATVLQADQVEVIDGGGIRGQVAGRDLRLGRAGFVSDQLVHGNLETSLLLADAQGPLAVFPFSEHLRADAADSLKALHDEGMQVEILSGDVTGHVAKTARTLGVKHWLARQSAEQKLRHLEQRRAAGAVLLAVGDGSNDAPLLAAADVSATVSGSAVLAQSHADLLLRDGLRGLPLALHVSRHAQTILVQNRRGAMIYNLCAVPFAAAGLVPPWLAVIGMSLSSLCVLLNALRIRQPNTQTHSPVGRLHGYTA